MEKTYELELSLHKTITVKVADELLASPDEDPKDAAVELAWDVFHGDTTNGTAKEEECECDGIRELSQ